MVQGTSDIMAEERIILKIEGSANGSSGSPGTSNKKANDLLAKSNKSFGTIIAKLSAIAGGMYLLKESSQYLKGTLAIFKRAFQLVLKPFGDFVGMILRPLAMLLLRWVRGVLGVKTKKEIKEDQAEATDKLGSGEVETTLEGLNDWWDSLIDSLMNSFNPESMSEKLILTLLEMVLKLPTLISSALYYVFLKIPYKIGEALALLLIEVVEGLWGLGIAIGDGIWNLAKDYIAPWLYKHWFKPTLKFFLSIGAKIYKLYTDSKTWVKEHIFKPFFNFFKGLFNAIKGIWDKAKTWVDTYIVTPIKSFFEKIKAFLDKLNPAKWFGGGSKKSGESDDSVTDAIISPNGKVITTDPQDYLIATKDPKSLVSGGGGLSNLTININIEKIDSEMRIRELAELISEEIQRKTSYMSGGGNI